MRAIQVKANGGPEVLAEADVATPDPGPGQVLVKLAATGVNFIETYQRSGLYQVPLPFVPGAEGAGEIVAVGEGVVTLAPGTRVASVNLAGSYADYAIVAADRVVPIPDDLETELAAAALLQGMTAHYLLFDSHPVREGEAVLVHAAAGGMGLLLTQLASSLGATVIATTSTPEKAELAKQAGAAHVLGYDDVPDKVREITGGAGVAAVYDGVGKTTFDASLASLGRRGTLVLYGYASGKPDPFDVNRLQERSAKLTRPTLVHFITERAELLERAAYVLGRVADQALDVRVGERYPLGDARRAHEDLQSRRTTGKLLLIPG